MYDHQETDTGGKITPLLSFTGDRFNMMKWYQNAIFYQIYLRAFADGDGDGHGDFIGLRDRLDYLEWLGIDCIWLMPIYPSPLKDDGYDIASYYGIHQDYGLLEDFRMTVQALKARGIRLITDLAVNHTSDQHPWFKEARRSKESPLRDYYVWSDTDDKYKDTRIIFLDTEESNWAYDEATGQFYWHRFYSSQPDLNFDNPAVQEEMLNIMKYWLDLGIDGFRVDAVPYLFEREGTNCENLPETHDYLKKMRHFVDENYPNAMLLAEANQWAKDLLPYFGDEENPEFHMCFNFPVMPRLYMALARKDRSSVVKIMDDTPDIPEGCQWATFLRNHDELTLEMVTPDDRQFMWDYYSPEQKQRINLGIRRRLAPLMNNDRRCIALMNSMLFTLPGTPVLYYGDEIGMGDNIKLFDRNGVRTPMQWEDAPNGGFSEAPPESLYAPSINDPVYGYHTVNVESQMANPDSLLHTIRQMIHTRKAYSVLATGELEWLDDLPEHLLCFQRVDGHKRFMALHNLSDKEAVVSLEDDSYTWLDAFDNANSHADDDTDSDPADIPPVTGDITLPPYGYRWLTLANSK
jgi:maltose alpha-D-glucosyltransferase/alpha-amylase